MPQGSSQVATAWYAERRGQPWRFLSRHGASLLPNTAGAGQAPAHYYTVNLADAAPFRDAGSVPARAGKPVRFRITYQREDGER